MRVFVIADSLRRKRRPYGVLRYDEERDTFQIEISQKVKSNQIPLSLGMYLKNGHRILDEDASFDWASSRVPPIDRQNIQDILAARGLVEYRVFDLLEQTRGFSSDDDAQLYEVDSTLCADLECDQIIDRLHRVSYEGEISYIFINLDCVGLESTDLDAKEGQMDSSHKIGRAISEARHEAGLTQKELAARAGIKQSVLSGVERGEGNPTIGLLADISRALGRELHISLR